MNWFLSKHILFIFNLGLILGSTISLRSAVAATGLTYHGRILKPDSTPLTSNNVEFHVQIKSPGAEDCLLYDETHTLDLSTTNGLFVLKIGTGTRAAAGIDGGNSLERIFANRGTLTLPTCTAGPTYTPGATDIRYLYVNFSDNGGPAQTLAVQSINSAPFAIEAKQVGGYGTGQLLRVADGTTATEFSNANWTELWNLITGASTVYQLANGSNFLPTASVDFNNQKIVDLADPTLAQDAATKNYSDTRIGGKTIDVSTVSNLAGNGHVLVWDQAQNRWETGLPSDSTKLPLTGGTMTGSISLGGTHSLTNIGHVAIADQGTLYLGKFTTAEETSLIATPLNNTTDRGRSWFNVTTGKMRIWDGTAASDVGADLGYTPVNKAGDTMSGLLVLSADPSVALGAATKQYVDAVTNATSGTAFRKDGTTLMTGNIQLNSNWLSNDGGSEGIRVDNSGNVGINVAAPAATLEVRAPTSATLLVGNIDPTGNPNSSIRLENFRKTWGDGNPSIISYVARGTKAAPAPVTKGLEILSLQGRGYAEAGFGADQAGARIDFVASNNWGNSNNRADMRFLTGGTEGWGTHERMRLTNTGNFGVGTYAPAGVFEASPLQYRGTGGVTAAQSGNSVTGTGTAFTAGMVGSRLTYEDGTDGGTVTGYTSATSISVSSSQVVANQNFVVSRPGLMVNSSGNVGIGTTSPNQLLTVEGPMSLRTQAAPTLTANYGKIYVDSGDGDKLKYMNPAGTIVNLSGGVTASGVSSTSSAIFNSDSDNAGSDGGFSFQRNGSNLVTISNTGSTTFIDTMGIYYNGSAVDYSPADSGWPSPWNQGLSVSNVTAGVGDYSGVSFGAGAHGYIGAVNSGGNLATVVIGAQTGATAYAERMRIDSAGNVAIGATSAGSKLDVRGAIRSVATAGSSPDNATTTVDWSLSNNQSMSVACTATTMNNMADGATYNLLVNETSNTACVFTGAGLTFYFTPANGARISGKPTIYSFTRIGANVVVSWAVLN